MQSSRIMHVQDAIIAGVILAAVSGVGTVLASSAVYSRLLGNDLAHMQQRVQIQLAAANAVLSRDINNVKTQVTELRAEVSTMRSELYGPRK